MRWVLIFAALFVFCGCESQPQQPPQKPQPAPAGQPAVVVEKAPAPQPVQGETVRRMSAAGQFYPADAARLRKDVAGYIDGAGEVKVQGRVVAIVAPHAGYVFSGPVAGFAYAAVKGHSYDTVVVLGSHMGTGKASVLDMDWYQTPLGYVRVDSEVVKKLLERDDFNFVPGRHAEHAIEVQVPFLQVALKEGFRIVAIAVTDSGAGFVGKVAKALAEELKGKKVLLVASTDLSHYPAYEAAKKVDSQIMEAWKTLDGAAIVKREEELMRQYSDSHGVECVMCGKAAVAIVVETAKMMDADSIDLLRYANSGDVPAGDKEKVVGYGAAVMYEKVEPGLVSEPGQRYLLEVAREAIEQVVGGRKLPVHEAQTQELKAKKGVFVSLYKSGRLRGCKGTFTSEKDLVNTVAEIAVDSATNDLTRFKPVKPEEVPELRIEISILSEPRRVESADEVVFGKHGILIVEKGGRRGGTYLPSVAKYFQTKEELLSSCCEDKAGLSADAWKTDKVEIHVYTAQVFGEKK